jgi:hypothetical protein
LLIAAAAGEVIRRFLMVRGCHTIVTAFSTRNGMSIHADTP